MSNLGLYQDIVTEASRAGGVDKLVRRIESGAVAKATPGLLATGVGVGVLLTVVAGAAAVGGKRAWDSLRARQAVGVAASAELAAVASTGRLDADSPAEGSERDAADAAPPSTD